MSKHRRKNNQTQPRWSPVIALSATALSIIVSIVGCNIGLMSWLKSDIHDVRDELRSFSQEVRGWREDMHKESKDFHARLSVLEHRK